MNKELFLNDEYVNALCSNESVEQVIPYLLSLLPVSSIPRTRKSNKLVEGLRQDSDSIHAFIAKECCVNPEETVEKTKLYEAYVQFCLSSGRESHKKHGFLRNLKSQGFLEIRDPKTREACWKGITLKSYKKR